MLIVMVHNVSPGEDVAKYEYRVQINRDVIAVGRVQHTRAKGWRDLIRRVAADGEKKKRRR